VDAVAAIQQHIAQIQTRIAQLEPRFPATTAPSNAALRGTSGIGQAGTFGTGTDGTQTAFGAVLDSLGVPATGSVGSGKSQVNAKNVPLEYLRYGNGRIPADRMSTISGTNHRTWPLAARSFEAMRAAAARDGVTIGITDSYRSYEGQVDVAARKGLYSKGGLAAVPGTSNHGWGMALDLKLDANAQAWMRAHAQDYAFTEAVPREPWHWEYHPTT
jgi:zinc D-Ala-D-Ala carboxypeptidase